MAYSKEFMNWVRDMTNDFEDDLYVYGRKIDGKRKGFIVVDTSTGKVAYSWCHPDEAYDTGIGVALAYARLKHIPIPEMEMLPTIEDCVGKWVETLHGTIVYVTPIRNTFSMLTLTRYGDKKYLDKKVKCKIIQ